MNTVKPTTPKVEETAVDDVRRVRERLSRDTGNDVHRLAEHAREVSTRLREKLGLKPISTKP